MLTHIAAAARRCLRIPIAAKRGVCGTPLGLPSPELGDGMALLPWAHRDDRATAIPEVAVRILMRGAAMADTLGRNRISARTTPSTPDIDAVLEHDPLHMVED